MREVYVDVHKDHLREFLKQKLLLGKKDAKKLGVLDMCVENQTKTDKYEIIKQEGDMLTLRVLLAYLN